MIDSILFQRGHINVRIDDCPIDDYDIIIPEHYFQRILGLTGEVIDANGSEYELVDLSWDDHFDIIFTVDEVEFETINGIIFAFKELVVRCTGTVVPIDGGDVLKIETYYIISRDGELI